MAALQDDELLREFFGNAASGFFVEVGVSNPAAGSRTLALENAGWRGALIEPLPDLAAFLVTVRRAKVFAAACVAADEAGRPMALRVVAPLTALGAGPKADAKADYTIMAQTRTLDDILLEAGAPLPLDLLALDAHGHELDALLGFDFERWRPRLVVIADPIADLQRHRFLKESGYRLIRRASGCGWYVPQASAAPGRHGRLRTLRDYYLLLPFRKVAAALRRLNARIMAMPDR